MESMLFLILIIVLVSGLIAYIGDLVGRKMGRKRLTLLNLRPRHTAIVISVGVGMLIAALTLLTTFLVSRDVREAFLVPRGILKQELARLKIERDRKAREVTKVAAELDATRADAVEIAKQLKAQTVKVTAANAQLTKSIAQRDRAAKDLANARKELTTVQRKLQDKHRELSRAQDKLVRIQDNLTATQDEVKRAEQRVLEVGKQRIELEDERVKLESRIAELTQRMEIFSVLAAGVFVPPVFTSGQEIIAGLVPVSGSEEARKAHLGLLLDAAERVVRRHSPKMPAEMTALVFIGGEEENPVRLTRTEAVQALANRVEALNKEANAIVRIAPLNNVPENGQALIGVDFIEIIPNERLYREGQEVARIEFSVDDSTSQAEIFGRLADGLLRESVPGAFRHKKLAMLTRRFDPAAAEPVREGSGSMVSWHELLDAVERVRKLRGTVRVVASMRKELRRFDPPAFTLEVVQARQP